MAVRAVHWHEGMFLRPHHFQLAQRHSHHALFQNTRWDQEFYWGVRRLEFDAEALSAFRFVLRRLEARFRDGTVLSIPEDGPEPSVDLKQAFMLSSRVDVYLAIPQLREGHANASDNPSSSTTSRYRVNSLPIEDENTGVNSQPIPLRSINFKILIGDEDRSGYEVLPLARFSKSDRAEGAPELDTTYIPPVLAGDAWPTLQTGILQYVYFRLNKKIEVLASQVKSRGITFDSHSPGDGRRLAQLMAVNEAYALLGNLAFVPGVHPFDSYVELCRFVGRLSVFGSEVRPPEIPRYNHDDLGGCFWKVKQYIDTLLNDVDEPTYEEAPFVGAGLRMEVAMQSKWLETSYRMYLGVRSSIAGEECVRMLTRPERLGMKIGSSDRVDQIFMRGMPGLVFSHCPAPPRDLPSAPNLTYFEVARDSAREEWANVQRSLRLAIRIKEGDIVGNIQGQRELTIRTGGTVTSLQLTLFMVPTVK